MKLVVELTGPQATQVLWALGMAITADEDKADMDADARRRLKVLRAVEAKVHAAQAGQRALRRMKRIGKRLEELGAPPADAHAVAHFVTHRGRR